MCTTDTSSVFIDQHISYINTTDTSVNITCLEPNTCYILGIRAVYSGIPLGEWTLLANRTLSIGEDVCQINNYDDECLTNHVPYNRSGFIHTIQ